MHQRSFLLALAASFATLLSAQEVPDSMNLVPNGGFEQIEGKLRRLGGIEAAKGWQSPTEAKADLYSETVDSDSPVHVPKNANGFESGLNGQNYAGVRWYSYMDKEPRSYLQVKLKKMLKKGHRYCITYYVSLSDLSKYSADHLGAYLAPIVSHKKNEASLTYTPQVPALMTREYKTVDGWEGVCGVYEAKGNEQYLVIGNFAATDKINAEKVRRHRGETRPQKPEAYYFIDDVSVKPIEHISDCSCTKDDKEESQLIFSWKGTRNPNLTPSAYVDQSRIYFKRYSTDVAESMRPLLDTLATVLKAHPAISIKLTGNTDAKEVERTRMRPDLSELDTERAGAVKDFLVKAGISADRITTAGSKGDNPAADGKDDVSMSQNRRVEIDVVK